MRPRVTVAMDRAQHGSLSCSSDPSSHERWLLPQIPRSVAAEEAVTADALGGESVSHTCSIPVLLAVTRPARLPCRGCSRHSRPDWWTREPMHAAAGWPFTASPLIPRQGLAGVIPDVGRQSSVGTAHYPPSPWMLASAMRGRQPCWWAILIAARQLRPGHSTGSAR
ncbi:hypothetical protein P171DRAFT_14095 [Karstenula rhodostoma CBS 690.94]|uniref:Uncharacterized protein n=1 Tax=Karstenula rhodostoma CBS 690.94 TaxID=1392251 RepID=A0A9P4PZQ1_9PLEO|nr:hypothetical protein P171DRAFT_14095 [Karstenula rhodostoma CBS 690.94]